MFTNIPQYITFPILLNIPLVVSNINITQYYSILPILLNITYSILLNIPNSQNFAFPIQCANIHQYYKPLPISINIPQYYLSNLEMLGPQARPGFRVS